MYVKDGNTIRHVNARYIQPYIDDGGYEIWDNNKNVVTGDALREAVDKEIEGHTGHADSVEDLEEQLKALGIKINKED